MIQKYTKKSAFTLIELLVVITIIGILTTVGGATFGGAKEKARIAKAIAFERESEHKLRRKLTSEGQGLEGSYRLFNFEEGTGSIAKSETGSRSYHTEGGTLQWTTDTPHSGSQYAVHFENGTYLNEVGGIYNVFDEITISAWIKLNNPNLSAISFNAFGRCGTTFLTVSQRLYFRSTGSCSYLSSSQNPWAIYTDPVLQLNTWHHIMFTDDGDQAQMYLDGNLIHTLDHAPTQHVIQYNHFGRYSSPTVDFYMDNLRHWPFTYKPGEE